MPIRVAVLILTLLSQTAVAQRVIYVDADAQGNGSGVDWANAYRVLQKGLLASAYGDEVWVAAGTYRPASRSNRSASFNLPNGVAVYGGFVGTETERNERAPLQHITYLSGDIGAVGEEADNVYHVVTAIRTDTLTVLDGFTVTGGNADGDDSDGTGGGVAVRHGALRIKGVRITGNRARRGGGLALDSATVRIKGGALDANTALLGGGLYSDASSLEVREVILSGNTATDGGGFWVSNSEVTVYGGLISQNTSERYGGGGHAQRSALALYDCAIEGNRTQGSGGGLYSDGVVNRMEGCTVLENTSATHGGGIASWAMLAGAALTITRSVFRSNQSHTGGAVLSSGTTDIMSSTFESNLAVDHPLYGWGGYGGALSLGGGFSIDSSLFVSNAATYLGGAANLTPSNGPRIGVATNCTFQGNQAERGGAIHSSYGTLRVHDSVFDSNEATHPSRGAGALSRNLGATYITGSTFVGNRSTKGVGAFQLSGTGVLYDLTLERNVSPGGVGGGVVGGYFHASHLRVHGNKGARVGGLSATGSFSIANSSFVGNRQLEGEESGSASALLVESNVTAAINITVVGNVHEEQGAALGAQGGRSGKSVLRIENSLIWGNGPLPIRLGQRASIEVKASLVEGGYDGPNVLDTDPLLLRLPDPGSDGEWGTGDDDYGDLRLDSHSPARDVGHTDALPRDVWDANGDGDTDGPIPIDLGGNTRVQGAAVDLGAYESTPSIVAAAGEHHASVDMVGDPFPNPSTGHVTVPFTLSGPHTEVRVEVFDTSGRCVRQQREMSLGAGQHHLRVDVSGLSSTVYIVRVRTATEVFTRRIVVIG